MCAWGWMDGWMNGEMTFTEYEVLRTAYRREDKKKKKGERK